MRSDIPVLLRMGDEIRPRKAAVINELTIAANTNVEREKNGFTSCQHISIAMVCL